MILARNISAIVAASLLTACANTGANYQPVIDGPVGPNYGADLASCQSLAASQPAIDGSTAGAAAAGAGVAAASSVIINDNSDNLGEAAAVGALVGATGNAIQKNQQKEEKMGSQRIGYSGNY